MMKAHNLFFAVTAAMLALASCNKDEPVTEPEPDPEPEIEYNDEYYAENATISSKDSNFTKKRDGGSIQFKAEGGEVSVLVNCGTDWLAENDSPDIFTAEITDADYVVITASQNLGDDELTGTITLETAEMHITFATITVTQDGMGHITISSEEMSFPPYGGEETVTVESTYDWECEFDATWLSIKKSGNSMTVNCDANYTGEARDVRVRVTAGENSVNTTDAELTISQDAFPSDALILEYTVTTGGTTIELPLISVTDAVIDWGDGETQTSSADNPSHTFSSPAIYSVSVTGMVKHLKSGEGDRTISGAECLNAVIQWGDTGLTSMDKGFFHCVNLLSLPEGPGPFSNVETFNQCFSGCTSLKDVPEKLFQNCPAVTDYSYAFNGCTSLVSAPSFERLSAGRKFYAIFAYCSSLKTLPENMFAGCTSATDFTYVFYGCTSLVSVPENLFSGCTAADSFSYAFGECTNLTSAPEKLFSGCASATDFYGVFFDCLSLKTLSGNMFSGCASALDFGWAFYKCWSINTLPEGLFDDCAAALYFDHIFYRCTSLKTVPVGLFDGCTKVTYFEYAFNQCYSISGESPYSEIDGNKVHLYERADHSGRFTAPTNFEECFTSSTFSDIESIPSGWK